jgi:laminin, beta 1
LQLVLIPRIEVTPIFAGSAPAENRMREYVRHGCNQTYYEVNYDSSVVAGECKDLLNQVSIYVFNGATREY